MGLLVYSNDNVYSGEFDKQNRPHGNGKYIENSGRYEYDGEWEYHLQHGQGCETTLNPTTNKKDTYRGDFEGGTVRLGVFYSGGYPPIFGVLVPPACVRSPGQV